MSLAFPKPRPRIFAKRDEQRAAEQHKRAVYAAVDARDGKRCRCCGRRGNPYAVEALGRIHRAHLRDASRGGPLDTWNLVSLCAWCHSFQHAKVLHVIGANADKPLRFELHPCCVADVFGTNVLPSHVRIRR